MHDLKNKHPDQLKFLNKKGKPLMIVVMIAGNPTLEGWLLTGIFFHWKNFIKCYFRVWRVDLVLEQLIVECQSACHKVL